jgi:beta-glucosidase
VPRLHLQAYTTGECLHGVIATNVTVFPQSISLAATFDRDLVGRVAAAIGREVRGRRNAFERSSSSNKTVGYWDNPPALLCFSPQINIVRDPRWGRNQETYGESPFLTGTLANTYVRHLQGDHPRYLQAVATPKHFNAFGGRTSNGTYPTGSPTDVTLSLRDWVETFLTAFEHVLDSTEEAGNNNTAESTMCSYNNMCQVDDYEDTDEFENRVQTGPCPGPAFGVPACASKGLLKDTLRNTWEWNGYVFGDDGAIKYIQTDHHWADDQPHAARDALDAGVDMALGGGCSDKNVPEGCISYGALPEALHERLVTEQGIDAALHRVLRARFRLGLMDDPVKLKHAGMAANPYESIPPNVVDSPAHRALAREAAEKSVVLLKNGEESYASTTGSLPLPLPRAREFGTIAVIGPNANVTLSGNYAGSNPVMSTMLGGICAATSRPVDYARGCDIDSNDTSGFDAAVAAARNANVTIFFAGLSQMQEHEGGKRASIAMPGVQDELMSALRDVTDALIVVIVGGSAISAGWAAEHADAVLWVGYGGEEAGHGFASVLFGDVSPSGKMPFTMYNGDYQLPIFGRYDMRGKAYGGSKGRTFRFLETRPLWYFGYGLGYSRFEMSKLVVTPVRDVPVCSPMELHLQVEEIAGVRGAEIVQVYVSRFDPKENPQAVRVSLAGYQRVFLEAGQKKH